MIDLSSHITVFFRETMQIKDIKIELIDNYSAVICFRSSVSGYMFHIHRRLRLISIGIYGLLNHRTLNGVKSQVEFNYLKLLRRPLSSILLIVLVMVIGKAEDSKSYLWVWFIMECSLVLIWVWRKGECRSIKKAKRNGFLLMILFQVLGIILWFNIRNFIL